MGLERLYCPRFKEPDLNRKCQGQNQNPHWRALEPLYWPLPGLAPHKMVAASRALPTSSLGGSAASVWADEAEADWFSSIRKGWDKPGGHILLRVFQAGFQCMEIPNGSSNRVSNIPLENKPLCLNRNQFEGRMLLCLHIREEESLPWALVKITERFSGHCGQKPSET